MEAVGRDCSDFFWAWKIFESYILYVSLPLSALLQPQIHYKEFLVPHSNVSYETRLLMISILTSGIYQRTGTIDPLVLSGQIKRVLEEANKTGKVDAPKPSKTPDPVLFKGIEKTRDGYAKKTPSTKVAYIIHAKGPVDRRIFIQINTANCMLLPNGEMMFGGACSLKELENVLNTSLGNIDAEAVAFVGSPRNWEARHYYIKEHWAAFFVTQHPQASPTVQAAVKKLMGYLDWITPEFWDKVSAPEVEQPSVESLAHTTPEPTPEFAVGYVIHAKGFVHSRTFATINVSSCTLLPGDDMVLTGVCSLQALQRYLEIDLIDIDYEAATFTEGLKTWNPEFYYTKSIGIEGGSSYGVYRPDMSQQAWDAVKRLDRYLIGIPEDYENRQPLGDVEQPSVEALSANPISPRQDEEKDSSDYTAPLKIDDMGTLALYDEVCVGLHCFGDFKVSHDAFKRSSTIRLGEAGSFVLGTMLLTNIHGFIESLPENAVGECYVTTKEGRLIEGWKPVKQLGKIVFLTGSGPDAAKVSELHDQLMNSNFIETNNSLAPMPFIASDDGFRYRSHLKIHLTHLQVALDDSRVLTEQQFR